MGSEGSITISDGEQVLAETGYDISAENHHDMAAVDIDELAQDENSSSRSSARAA